MDAETLPDDFDLTLPPAQAKRVYRDQRLAERRAKRVQWRRQVRCWFTFPFKHEFAAMGDDYPRCVGCGKPRP